MNFRSTISSPTLCSREGENIDARNWSSEDSRLQMNLSANIQDLVIDHIFSFKVIVSLDEELDTAEEGLCGNVANGFRNSTCNRINIDLKTIFVNMKMCSTCDRIR